VLFFCQKSPTFGLNNATWRKIMALTIGGGITFGGGISVLMNNAPFEIGAYWTAEGGYYAGAVQWPNGQIYDLVIAAKADRPHQSTYGFGKSQWSETEAALTVSPATAIVYSYDGASATAAYAAAGFVGATGVNGVTINGFSDWYVPSLNELYAVYRNLKPTTDDNATYATVGFRYSNLGITQMGQQPYAVGGAFTATAEDPARTTVAAFQSGGAQAFSGANYNDYYWSSTPIMASSGSTTDSASSIFTFKFTPLSVVAGFYQDNSKTDVYSRLPMRKIARA
jgi:hypothetical protein